MKKILIFAMVLLITSTLNTSTAYSITTKQYKSIKEFQRIMKINPDDAIKIYFSGVPIKRQTNTKTPTGIINAKEKKPHK